MRLRVRYHRPADLVADADRQFQKGGLLVRVEAPAGTSLYEPAELEIVTPEGETLRAAGQVIHVVAGAGVAVSFDPAGVAGLREAVEAARAAGDREGSAAEHALVGPESPAGAASPAPARAQAAAPAGAGGGTKAEKIQQALHGNRDERAAILRDLDKTLHAFVLRNPGVQADEIPAMARMTTVAPELLQGIADRRDWAQRPEVALALVRNPKVPVPTALRLLGFVAVSDLRQLAKDPHARGPIQQAARKKILA